MNAATRIRVLVVDDSAFMRRALVRMIEKEPDIEVAGTAESGEEAVRLSESLAPDVVTMDVEMPGIGGLAALRLIVERSGPPVIMVSSWTRPGSDTTLQALEMGAVDFIPKPDSAFIDILKVASDLVTKIRAIASAREQRRTAVPDAAKSVERSVPAPTVRFECVALGTSTGGPVALSRILPSVPAGFRVPIVIVQHMPPGFTRPLAERLNLASAIEVVEGEDGTVLRAGLAIIAAAGRQVRLVRENGNVVMRLDADIARSLHVPSVDLMVRAVAEMYGAATLGVILTGMGHDGVEGLRELKRRGGYVVGQDEQTSVVYGMPRAAALAGLVDRVVPLERIASTLSELTGSE